MVDYTLALKATQPNPLAAYMQGVSAKDAQSQIQQRREREEFFKEQGGGVLRGEQSALEGMARFDPQGALQAQSRLAAQGRVPELAGAPPQQAPASQVPVAEPYGANMDSAGIAQERADLQEAVTMMSSVQSPEEWDQLAQEHEPGLVGKFNDRDAITKEASRLVETLSGGAGEAALVGGEGDDLTEEKPPKLTVDASKNTGFYIRMLDDNGTLDELEDQGTEFMQQMLESVPFGLGNYARTPEFQRYDQARRGFLNAILRRESGAVISDSEFDNANKQYFPVPGDKPPNIAQKREARQTAIEGMRIGAGEGAGYADRQRAAAAKAAADNPYTEITDDDFKSLDINSLTDEQIRNLAKARGLN
jgi:hypothetical protein